MQLSYLPTSQIPRHALGSSVRATLLVLASLVPAAGRADQSPKPLDAAAASRLIESYFASLPGYQPGDLITRVHVAQALALLNEAGWKETRAEEILQRALPEDSFLAAKFATPSGRRFMRKFAREPGAYSRLDRLSSISNGKAIINELIGKKGGDEMIRYLTTTKGGHNLGKFMAATPHGVDLNKPTGRIYTAEDLIAALNQAWDEKK